MGDTGTGARARRASRGVYTASQRAGRAGAAAAGGAGRFVHRMSGASGAGRTGLSSLIELTAAAGVGDAFVALALAGTLFFSASVEQARSRAALALIITIAPYAILAPLIGPLLDRVQQGNRFILSGTLLARGLLCWGMSGAVLHNDSVTLLPAAFGVLVLQKAYGVTRAAVTPRLLPAEITLVTANARSNLGSLIATSAGAGLALGIGSIMGGGDHGAAWVLRLGTIIYLAAMVLAFRLPETVDAQQARPASAAAPQPGPGPVPGSTVPFGAQKAHWHDGSHDGARVPHQAANGGPGYAAQPGQPAQPGYAAQPGQPGQPGYAAQPGQPGQPGYGAQPGAGPQRGASPSAPRRRRIISVPKVGPAVAEAMRANAAIRVFYGFMIFFLAFILRSEKFGHTSDKIALAGLAVAIAAGGMIGTVIGSALRARAPQALMFMILAIATAASITCAVLFGLWSVLAVALAAAISQTLVKVALDSILQREIPEQTRSSTFAFSETIHQLALVGGGLLGLALSLTGSGFAGLTVAAAGLAIALCGLLLARRRRLLRASQPG